MSERRLLVIDDDPAILELIKIGCESKDFVVDEAESAAEAKTKLENGSYQLVLCDWMLPDVSGDRLLAWAKQQPGLKDIPFIMVTAKDQKDYVIKAIRLGADGYIVKPFTIDRLYGKVESILEQRRRQLQEQSCNALVHFRNHALRGKVLHLREERMGLRIGRDSHLPRLLELVSVTLEHEGRVSAYAMRAEITGLRMEGEDPRSEVVELSLRLRDLTDQNREELAQVHCLSTDEG